MPTRLVREGILDSKAVNALSEPAEILYRRLMSIVDDYGRFEADADLIRARCFPRQFERWSVDRIEKHISELSSESQLVTVYSCGAKNYLQINNFGQRIQSKPRCPGPDSLESTVINGESPPRASRARTKSESYSKSESDTESLGSLSPKNGSSHGSRFSLEELPDDWKTFAMNDCHWDEFQIQKTFVVFSDYWKAATGAKARKADWFATWRNWCRREDEKPGVNGNAPMLPFAPRETATEKSIRVGFERVQKTGRL